jgi:hypothetical protein
MPGRTRGFGVVVEARLLGFLTATWWTLAVRCGACIEIGGRCCGGDGRESDDCAEATSSCRTMKNSGKTNAALRHRFFTPAPHNRKMGHNLPAASAEMLEEFTFS